MELRGGVAGGWRIQHNVFCRSHFSPYIFWVITCHGASQVHGSGDTYRVWFARSARKRLLVGPRCTCADNIKRVVQKQDVGRVAQSVQRLATGWTVRGSNPGEGEIFRTCSDRPWGPPSLLYNGYRVFPGDKKRPGRDCSHSPTSSAVGDETVELYLYFSYGPYGLYRAPVPVQGCTLPYLTFYLL